MGAQMGVRIKKGRWPLMHAVLAHGWESPSHETLSAITEISTRTISNLVAEIGSNGPRLLTGGHPARLGPGAGLVLGLSVGSQSVRGALVDANGALHHQYSAAPLPGQLDLAPPALFVRVRQVALEVLKCGVADETLHSSGYGALGLLGAGLSWPGPLDRGKRPQGYALRDRAWRHVDSTTRLARTIKSHLAEALGEPFTSERCNVIHDASAHALSVAFHDSRTRTAGSSGRGDMWRVGLVLRAGETVGVSSMLLAPATPNRLSFIDSKLIEGSKGLAGELGHLHLDKRVIDDVNAEAPAGLASIDYQASECSCGRKHHLEAFASVRALVRRLEASEFSVPEDGPAQEALLRSARDGLVDDPVALGAGTAVGRVLGYALAGPILLLDPSTITVTGPLASEHLVRGIGLVRNAWASAVNDSVKIDIDRSGIEDYIGVQGAALAVIRQKVYRDFLDAQSESLPATFAVGNAEVEQALEGEMEDSG